MRFIGYVSVGAVAVAGSLALSSFSSLSAKEHYPGEYANAPHRQWYEAQKNGKGLSCCDHSDAHDFYGNYTLTEDGGVEIQDGKSHYKLSSILVLKDPNPTGHAIWWYIDYMGARYTYCFAPGAGG